MCNKKVMKSAPTKNTLYSIKMLKKALSKLQYLNESEKYDNNEI